MKLKEVVTELGKMPANKPFWYGYIWWTISIAIGMLIVWRNLAYPVKNLGKVVVDLFLSIAVVVWQIVCIVAIILAPLLVVVSPIVGFFLVRQHRKVLARKSELASTIDKVYGA